MKKRTLWIGILALSIVSMTSADEGIWTRKANMPTARYVFSTEVVDGKLYAIGGDPGSGTALSRVDAYDLLTDTWTRRADIPLVRAATGSSVVNGRIYLMGGGASRWVSFAPTVQTYDPATDTWSMKADMPTARGWLSASTVNGKIYAIGGALAFEGTVLSTVEEYNPATDTWTRKADMPTARACLSTSVVDGKIYAIGGTVSKPWSQATSIVEEYDPITDTWMQKNDMPTPRSYFSTSVLGGRICAVGGFSTNYIALSSVEQYDPATENWTTVGDMPTPRWGLSTSVVENSIFAIGGRTAQGFIFSTVEEYCLNPPSLDFNGDGLVNIKDLLRLIESWGSDDPIVDIAPLPFGDGIVDVLDLELLMSFWGQQVDDPTLVAHWALDEAEDNIAYDSAGVNDAFLIGEPIWQPESGKVGGALAFDGIDDCVLAQQGLNPADGSFSVLAWIQGGAPGQVVISQSNGANWLRADSASGCLMTELCAWGRNGSALHSNMEILDGNWHRVGFVWDGLNRALYVDDILAVEDTQQGLASSVGGMNVGCGMYSAVGTFWSGLIDDIRIYNRVVSP